MPPKFRADAPLITMLLTITGVFISKSEISSNTTQSPLSTVASTVIIVGVLVFDIVIV